MRHNEYKIVNTNPLSKILSVKKFMNTSFVWWDKKYYNALSGSIHRWMEVHIAVDDNKFEMFYIIVYVSFLLICKYSKVTVHVQFVNDNEKFLSNPFHETK